MQINLSPETERLVQDLSAGPYENASAVIETAVRLLFEEELKHRAFREKMERAAREIDEGHGQPLRRELLEQILADGRERLAQLRSQ